MLLLRQVRAPSNACPWLPPVIGSRSTTTSSRLTGTVALTVSVTIYLRDRARLVSICCVPTCNRSCERVIGPIGAVLCWC